MKRLLHKSFCALAVSTLLYTCYSIAVGQSAGTPTMSIPGLIEKKGHPAVVIGGFDRVEKGDGFVLLTFYGVTDDPKKISRTEDGRPSDHYLVYCSDRHFLRTLEVHFEDMKTPETFVGSSMYASRNSGGTVFEIAHVTSDGKVSEIGDYHANMVKLDASAKPARDH